MKKLLLEIKKLEHSLTKLEAYISLTKLEAYITQDHSINNMLIDATIKRFECTFELLWKTLRVYFLIKGLDLPYPKDVLKEAYIADLLDDEVIWLRMLQDFNITGLSYDDQIAAELFKRITAYLPFIQTAANKINLLLFDISLDT